MPEESKTYVFQPDQNNIIPMISAMLQNKGCDPTILAMLNNRNNGWLNGDGNILALIILFAIFGGGFGNFGGGFGFNRGGCNGIGTDLIMQTLNRNGLDINSLATSLNTSVSNVQNGLNALGIQLQTVGNRNELSVQALANAVQAGDANLASQIAQCCCDNKLLVTNQGYESRIATLEQTNQLGAKIDANTNAMQAQMAAQTTFLSDKFCDLEKRELQNKIDMLRENNTQLKTVIDNANQTQQLQNYVAGSIAPVASALNALQTQVSDIKCKLPESVTVPYSPVTPVPSCVAWNIGLQNYGLNNGGSIWN